MKNITRLAITLSIVFGALNSSGQSNLPGGTTGLEAYINTVLQAFSVPGMSIAIVKNGKVLLAGGYGVKQLCKPGRVDGHTLFAIGSNTKAFTATALVMLAEEGKLKLDDPVINYLPWFRMSDDYATMHITIRDILVHQSGLPGYAGDNMIFPPAAYTRKEIVQKLKDIPLVNPFRTVYAYDNILYLAAGEVIEAVSGMSWEDFIKKRIFETAGMTESLARFSDIKTAVNVSGSHKRLDNKIQVFKDFSNLAIGDAGDPCGGIMSNAADMAKWLITQLDSGRTPTHNKLFAPSATNDLWTIVRPIPVTRKPDDLKPAQMDFYGYSLGFRTYNYGQYKIVGHGGQLDGFVSQVAMVPALNLGIAVFTNQESSGAYWSVIYHLLDYYAGNTPFDWVKGFKRQEDLALSKSKAANATELVPDTTKKASLPIEKYQGLYHDNIYGDVLISKDSGYVRFRFLQLPHLKANLSHFQYDTFRATFDNKFLKADAYVSFSLNPDGSIASIKMKVIDPDSDIDYSDVFLRPVKQDK